MHVLERRDVGKMYVGEKVCWWICMKLYVDTFTNIQKKFENIHRQPSKMKLV